jgi:membrane fusion protein (multidrug efflux system)
MNRQSKTNRTQRNILCAAAGLLVAVLLLGGCGKTQAPSASSGPEVTVLDIEPKDAPVTFEFVGVTASSQQVEVRARVDGFLDERLYTEGSIVRQGDVMFKMDAKPFQAELDAAEAALAQQQARLWTAQANLKRVKPLAKANAVSKKELDDAQGTVNAAAAAVEMAKADVETARLNLGYTTIYAPVTGVASFARIQDGAYVNAQSGPLTYVAQIDPMWVDFSISEDEMLSLRRQMAEGSLRSPGEEKLDVEIVMADGSGYPESGKIFFRDANYNTQTGTFLVRATFPNQDDALRPGQFVRVRVKGAIRPKAILVPQQAVLQGAQGFFVWLVDAEGKAQVRNVEVGDWAGNNWFITSGLSAGERVITEGLMRLAKGVPVKIVDKRADEAGGQPGEGEARSAPDEAAATGD